jgi:hypothetical protein
MFYGWLVVSINWGVNAIAKGGGKEDKVGEGLECAEWGLGGPGGGEEDRGGGQGAEAAAQPKSWSSVEMGLGTSQMAFKSLGMDASVKPMVFLLCIAEKRTAGKALVLLGQGPPGKTEPPKAKRTVSPALPPPTPSLPSSTAANPGKMRGCGTAPEALERGVQRPEARSSWCRS